MKLSSSEFAGGILPLSPLNGGFKGFNKVSYNGEREEREKIHCIKQKIYTSSRGILNINIHKPYAILKLAEDLVKQLLMILHPIYFINFFFDILKKKI